MSRSKKDREEATAKRRQEYVKTHSLSWNEELEDASDLDRLIQRSVRESMNVEQNDPNCKHTPWVTHARLATAVVQIGQCARCASKVQRFFVGELKEDENEDEEIWTRWEIVYDEA